MTKDMTNRRASDSRESFPETSYGVLRNAADSKWEPFLESYVRPCWREILIACRSRGLNLPDTEDVFQELMLRLLREGNMSPQLREAMAALGEDPQFLGNLPGRYLKSTSLHLHRVRFRTYLKATILNLVRELVRTPGRRSDRSLDEHLDTLEPEVDESLLLAVDTQWFDECVHKAACDLRVESANATTRGVRRRFDSLYLSVVEGLTPAQMAAQYGVSRSTMSSVLSDARERFVMLLREHSGTSDLNDLKELLRVDPMVLLRALRAAKE